MSASDARDPQGQRPRIVFFRRGDAAQLRVFEYYRQDLETLEALGYEIVVCTRYREIPTRFDAIFVWWWTYALWPVLLARMIGKPSFITGAFDLEFPAHLQVRDYHHRPFWQRVLISAATRLCDRNLFISETELRRCSEFFRLTNARLYPCSVNDDYLQGPGPTRELSLFNLAWSDRGNLVRKGIPDLLEAMALLKRDGVDVRLRLGGPQGDGAAWLRERIRALGLEGTVSVLGEIERGHKIELLRTCEVYVQPSRYEGFGLATAEAMGCGACVVTCDVGAVRGVVGDCAIYVEPGNPESIAQGIKRAMTNAGLRNDLQRRALARARAVFVPELKLDRLREYLAEVGVVGAPEPATGRNAPGQSTRSSLLSELP